MADPGDVVTVDFVGATGTKRRPAVVVSSTLYHQVVYPNPADNSIGAKTG